MMEAGVDEVGRGPLAGPVVAAAVILPPNHGLIGLADSKVLSEKKRLYLAEKIREVAIDYAIVFIEIDVIDSINILQASLLAMKRAIEQLNPIPSLAWVDGNQSPKTHIPVRTLIGGDKLMPIISAASIIAKVARDQFMCDLALQYPEYGFEKHKGYGTVQHLAALQKYGVTPHHRRSFAPVAERIADLA